MDDHNNMSENNSMNEMDQQPTVENPFKNRKFYVAYFITLLIFCLVSGVLTRNDSNWMLGVLFLCIPYLIIGLFAWVIVRNNHRVVALGVLFGSITPFIGVFIGTGGCGLFLF